MFTTFFKSSIKSLIWLVLIPLVLWVLYILMLHNEIEATKLFGFVSWEEYGKYLILMSMTIAIVVNLLSLMIVPPITATIKGIDSASKRFEFYFSFFTNLVLSLILPIIFFYLFDMPVLNFLMLLGLHLIAFLVAFILGALFVAPVYARAFWFVDR